MIPACSRNHGRSAAKHRLYQRKRQPFGARNQDMDMMVPPYLHELPLITTKPDAIPQPKVPDYILEISFVRPGAEKIESPVALLPPGGGQRLKHMILAFTKCFVTTNCRKSHLV